MRDIIFGMAIGGILGMLLYKNSSCTREIFDKGEEIVMQEIEKYDNPPSKKVNTKKS